MADYSFCLFIGIAITAGGKAQIVEISLMALHRLCIK